MAEPTAPEAPRPQTAEEIELEWYRTVYQGDHVPQLTLRAVVMGFLLGGIMSLSNLYIGLKAGWHIGVVVTAAILSFTIHRGLRLFLFWLPGFRTPMSILENNCMQSTASSAGYSTGSTLVSAITAYLLIEGKHIEPLPLILWTFFLGMIGCFMAIPMKRQMINVEKLPFPTGIAAAETLKGLYGRGSEAIRKALALTGGAFTGVLVKLFGEAPAAWKIPAILQNVYLPGRIAGRRFEDFTVGMEGSLILVAAGAIVGLRTSISLVLGAAVNYLVLAPIMFERGIIALNDKGELGFRQITKWGLWIGVSIMVTSSLVAVIFQWKTVARAFTGMGKMFGFGAAQEAADDPLARIEAPSSWFVVGTTLAACGIVAVATTWFGISIPMAILAVVMTFFIGIVACRVTGETDITPTGAMGKITQLTYGVLAPGQKIVNLMTAGVTAGAASPAADLLTDLKSGYLLGANPRRQFLAQFFGVFAGTAVVVPAFYALVPDPSAINEQLPAPAAQVWRGVADLLGDGLAALHPSARWGILIGGLVGIVLPLLERRFPKRRLLIPSATGLGLAFVLPFYNSFSFLLGAGAAAIFAAVSPKAAKDYTIPVASGIIAGESLMGVGFALYDTAGAVGGGAGEAPGG